MSGKTLLATIVANLSADYNLSALLESATLEPEPRASGGSCDVTFGIIPLDKINHQVLSRCQCSPTSDENSIVGSGLMRIAIKRARAHALNSLSLDKRDKFIKRYAREIKIWSTLEHDNILRLLGYANESHTFPSLVTSWMTNGTAKQFLRDKPVAYKMALTYGVANGLAYLHSRNIIHGDLKAENVLVSEAGRALLSDFGISRVLMSDDFASMKTSSNNVVGTLRWMAIEQLSVTDTHDRYSLATDIWSFGMTVYEFLTGNIPFAHMKSEPQVILAIMNCQSPHTHEYPAFQSEQEVKLWEMCQSCWNANPKNRPPITTLLQHLPSRAETQVLTRYDTLDRLNHSSKISNIAGLSVTSTKQSLMLGNVPKFEPADRPDWEKWKEATDFVSSLRKEMKMEQESAGPIAPLNVTDLEIEKITILLDMFADLTNDIKHILPVIYYYYFDLHSIRSLLAIANIANLQRSLLQSNNPICIINFNTLEMLYYEFKHTRGTFLEVAQLQPSQRTSASGFHSETSQIAPQSTIPNVARHSSQTKVPHLYRTQKINLLELPYELIVIVLMHLPAKEIISFCSTNRFCHDLYGTTSILQYIVELEKSGCQDLTLTKGELGSPNRTEERRSFLRSKDASWRKLDLYRKAYRLQVDIESISFYDLTDGIFLMGSSEIDSGIQYIDLRRIYSYLPSPETPFTNSEGAVTMHQTTSRFHHLPVEGDIVDMGLALEEHDLIAIVTTTPAVRGDIVIQEIKLSYLRFSTCESHPLAKHKTITLMQYPLEVSRCSASVQIVGKHLILLISFPLVGIDFEPSACDELYILDWMSGDTISHTSHESHTFGGFTFITPTLFVISNNSLNALQLVHIFTREDGSEVPCWLRTLTLPELRWGKFISSSCESNPNVMGTSPDCIMDYIHGQKPVFAFSLDPKGARNAYGGNRIKSNPSKAIVMFHLTSMHRNGFRDADFIVHRSRLAELALESLEMHIALSRKLPQSASGSSNDLSRINMVDESGGGGSVRRLVTSESSTGRCSSTAGVNSGRDFALSFDLDVNGDLVYRIPSTEWHEWGPESTRFDQRNEEDVSWEVTTAGQRQVLMRKNSDEIIVKDFNPHAIRQQTNSQEHPFELTRLEGDTNEVRVVGSMDELPEHFVGGIEAYSSLPYVEYIIKPRIRYSAMLMDEDILIGISENAYPQNLDIFTIYP